MKIYNITPVPAPRMSRADAWKKRPIVLRYWAFKDEIKLKKVEVSEQCRIIFHIPMPDSWSTKKKDKHRGQPHLQRPDIDNLVKAILDCVFSEDSHIWDVHATKLWSDNGAIQIGELI